MVATVVVLNNLTLFFNIYFSSVILLDYNTIYARLYVILGTIYIVTYFHYLGVKLIYIQPFPPKGLFDDIVFYTYSLFHVRVTSAVFPLSELDDHRLKEKKKKTEIVAYLFAYAKKKRKEGKEKKIERCQSPCDRCLERIFNSFSRFS